MENKQQYAILGTLIGLGWIAYNVITNTRQNKDIRALKNKILKLEGLASGNINMQQTAHAGMGGYSGFATLPETYPHIYGAPDGSLKNYDASEMATGLRQPTVTIWQNKKGQTVVNALP